MGIFYYNEKFFDYFYLVILKMIYFGGNCHPFMFKKAVLSATNQNELEWMNE